MNSLLSSALFTLCVLGLSGATAADDAPVSGFYLSANVGQSSVDFGSRFKSAESLDEDDTAYEVLFGYQFENKWSLEAGWLDIGEHGGEGSLEAVNLGLDDNFLVDASGVAEVEGVVLRVGKEFSLTENLSFTAGAGVYFWEQETRWNIGGTLSRQTTRDEDLVFGLGLDYKIAPKTSVTFGWERQQLLESDRVYIGLKFNF
ncbi:MAG: outer membrane beta-barrel protein [Halioglobus sp.]